MPCDVYPPPAHNDVCHVNTEIIKLPTQRETNYSLLLFMSVRLLRLLSPHLPLTDQPAPLDVSLVTNTNTSTVITVGVSICKIFSPEFNSDHCGGRQCSGRILSASGIFYSFKQSSIYLHSPPTNTCELVLSSPDDSMF